MGGGKVLGSGRMWVAPAALEDPRAVKISMQGQGLPTEALLKRYLPPVRLCCSSQKARQPTLGLDCFATGIAWCCHCQVTSVAVRSV